MPPEHLSEDEIADYCGKYLQWAGDLLRKKAGPEAEDDAGAALFDALRSYDKSRGVPLEAYLRQFLPRYAAGEYRKLNGRAGSAKREAITTSVEVQDYDHPSSCQNPENAVDAEVLSGGGVFEILKAMEAIDDDAVRITGLCAALSKRRIVALGRAVRTDRATVQSRLDRVRSSV